MKSSRRDFVKNLAIYSPVVPFLFSPLNKVITNMTESPLDISIFSKHLQFLNFQDTGEAAAELGFSGVDLTVRTKGHVLPEEVVQVLPRAVEEIKAGGSNCKMITTKIDSVDDPLDTDTITTAGQLGIQFYRANWFKYSKELSLVASIAHWKNEVEKLEKFNKKNNIVGCYQNHSGTKIGASYWEINQLMPSDENAQHFGVQYDIRHAVAEGGRSWTNGLQLLQKQIKTIVLKDFKWGKVNGKWKIINVPIGEGMVDFDKYFKLLKKYQINVPVSLHLEYPLGGAEKGKKDLTVSRQVVFDAMKKDLSAIQELWKIA